MWGYAAAWKELTTMIGSVRPWGGEILSAEFHIRYYAPEALAALAYVAGLRFVRLHEPLRETTPQLVALLEK